ncbi:MAG: carbohydrate kinase family protein [Patescibacteria group bacterium]|jgi:sugar/nucleoside kinase (ribokinase family)
MKTIDLLTIGDTSIDLFMKVDKDFVDTEKQEDTTQICFVHGSKVPVESFETSIGGNAPHVGFACAKLGMSVEIYTELGDDANAERVIEDLKKHKIDTKFCIKNPGTPTNVHAIIVHQSERTIFSYHEKRNYKLYDWATPRWVFYSSLAKGFDNFQEELVKYLKLNPRIGIAFNPGTQQLREGRGALKNMLGVTDVLFVNREEAEMLTKKEADLEVLHKELQKLGPKLTVITEGKKGSSAYDGVTLEKMGIEQDVRPIVDKTGAGDAYAAGFLAALFYNKPLRTAMRWGTANSSSVIRDIGALKGLMTKEKLENLK